MLKNYIWFGSGAIVGAAVSCVITSVVLKKAFLKEAQKQIDEVVKHYDDKLARKGSVKYTIAEKEKIEEKKPEQKEEPMQNHILPVVESAPVVTEDKIEEAKDFNVDLEVISLDNFDECPDYSTEVFVLYADGILTDDSDIPLSESKIDNIFGPDMYDQICRCEDSSMYIKNPMERTIYEIVMCPTEFDG